MGDFGASTWLPMLLQSAGQAAPLMTKGDEPNQPFMTPPPSSGQGGIPPGLAAMAQPQMDENQMAIQLLMATMARLSQMQSAPGQQDPMQQAMGGLPGAGSPLQGNSIQQPMPSLPPTPLGMR